MNYVLAECLRVPTLQASSDNSISMTSGRDQSGSILVVRRGFRDFHVFVCAAFLIHFEVVLLKMQFQDVIMFLQNLRKETETWAERDVSTVLAHAFVLKSMFG